MRRSGGIWLLVVAVLVGVVALAAHAGLGTLDGTDRRMQLLYLCLVLAAGFLAPRGTTISHLGAWCVIFAALILIYSFRGEFATMRARLMAELVPAQGEQTGAHSVAFPLEADGHYHVEADVDGHTIGFLVDSGASDIVLSPADARMLGLDPATLDYSMRASTANGEVRGAPVQINRLKIGPIEMMELPATVNQADMSVSLLGMEFLSRLRSWSVQDGRLTFQQ
jgi:aspartyl protease family protein